MDSLAPGFLVAVPQLQDPDFSHTVTLLVDTGAEGSFGLVINRVSPITLAEICAQNSMPCSRELLVRIGGPCEQSRAWVLHAGEPTSEYSYQVGKNLVLTPTWEMLGQLALSPDQPFLVFLGHAGWGPGQLEKEMTEGSWLLTDIDADLLFQKEEPDLWRAVIRSMGLEPGTIAQGGGVH